MKVWIIAALVTLVALVTYVMVENARQPSQPATKRAEPPMHTLPGPSSEYGYAANPDKPDARLKTQRPLSLTLPEATKIVIPRGPRKPWENRFQYSDRVEFTAKLDAFLAHVDLTAEEQHRLMLALYDYQEANQNIHAEWPRVVRDSIEQDEEIDRSFYRLMTDTELEFISQLEAILTWGEQRLWNIHCGACHMYLASKGSILQKREAE